MKKFLIVALVMVAVAVLSTSESSFAAESTLKVVVESHGNTNVQTYHLNQVVSEDIFTELSGKKDVVRRNSEKNSELLKKLFKISGVSRATLGNRYEISIEKGKAFEWKSISPEVISVLKNHFEAKKLVVEYKSPSN